MSTESKQNTRRTQSESPLFTAINHRLVRNTKAEAEADFGTLKNLTSERSVAAAAARLNAEVTDNAEISLRELTVRYRSAVAEYFAESFRDESTGRALRSEARREVSLKLFEWTFGGKNPDALERAKMLVGRVSPKLLRRYCPEPGGEEEVDVCFTVLIHWDVISPKPTRTDDYPANHDRSRRMLALLEALKAELPASGLFQTVPLLDFEIGRAKRWIADNEYPTTLDYWTMLHNIGLTVATSVAANPLAAADLEPYSLPLNGLWIDDVDEGRQRFWIFPDNRYDAFCIIPQPDGTARLVAYELFFYTRDLDSTDYSEDFIIWTDVEVSQRYTRNPTHRFTADDMACLDFTPDFDNRNEIISLKWEPLTESGQFPLGIRRFTRIDRTFPRHDLFRDILERPELIKSDHYPLLKSRNSVMGVDNDYIYLLDYDYTYMNYEFQLNADGSYSFRAPDRPEYALPRNLTDWLLSPEPRGHLYRLPRKLKNNGDRLPRERFERLKAIVENFGPDNVASLIHFDGDSRDSIILYFNLQSVGMTLKEAISACDLRRITRISAPIRLT